jgi:hypothetical protein
MFRSKHANYSDRNPISYIGALGFDFRSARRPNHTWLEVDVLGSIFFKSVLFKTLSIYLINMHKAKEKKDRRRLINRQWNPEWFDSENLHKFQQRLPWLEESTRYLRKSSGILCLLA